MAGWISAVAVVFGKVMDLLSSSVAVVSGMVMELFGMVMVSEQFRYAVAAVFGWLVTELFKSGVTDEVKNFVFGMVKEHVGYFWNSAENVEKMKEEVENLKIMRWEVEQQITSAKRKGDDLAYGVKKWVKVVDADISKAEGFLVRDVNRYRYGKRAALIFPSLMEHQVRGMGYLSRVSVDTPAPGPLDVYQNKNLDDILTHNSCLEDIIKAIEDESKPIIGIFGLGGVGKTTLAMEVNERVKHLFDVVAFTTVSQTVSVEKIKKDLKVARKGIDQEDKVLVILDDVWKILDLEELCIPCGTKYKNCKILLTSRSELVCERMKAHKICVNALPKEEAWTLFKSIVGDVNADLEKVAKEVAEECGGLPLFLKAVGNALKTKSIQDWIKARDRLREPAPSLPYMDPEIVDAYTRLKLSYDFLANEVQSCFLLCCMFPEDDDILLEDLVYYAVGLAKFHDLKSMEDARQRVEDAVKILTSSGLLLNMKSRRYTKMHDVVRDVALIIASEDKNIFLVKAGKGLEKWLPRSNELKRYTGISLMNNNITKLPNDELHLPDLEIFLVSYNPKLAAVSGKLFQGMQKVKVLDMGYCYQSVLRGFQFLTKLRVLNLTENIYLVDISILGEMKELEILILNGTGINEIPQEIGQLVNLRRLEVMRCQHLKLVAKGVISKLWRLEELLIGLLRLGEGIDDRIVEIKNYIVKGDECIAEVMALSELKYLDLIVPCFDVIPEGFDFGKLKRFGIHIKKDLKVARKGIGQGEKVLVILDDIWKELDLKELCIPRGKYKVWLTSRSDFVCERMKAHKICVNALPKEEAWTLFKSIVGDVNADLEKVAKEVAEECGGLPLFLKAVGNALKTKSIQDWIKARDRLREPAPSLPYMDPKMQRACICVKLGYDFLNKEAQLCFLLCCLFPEDEKILLETLVYYVVGLAKFRLESMEDARNVVKDAVKKLTSAGLLLNLEDKRYTKMHDIVRDVALRLASEGESTFLVEAGKGLTEWLPRYPELYRYTGISLMKNEITKLPNYELHLPLVEVFLISDNAQLPMFTDELVQGMKQVKVLDMGYCNQSLLRGFQPLTKLRVLNLMDNVCVVDISILGEMTDLEILILNNTGIKEIPQKIGRLVYLRRLDVLGCQYLNDVADGVISKLWRLEELRIGFTPWIGTPLLDREIYDRIVEVMKLPKLAYLDLVVPHFDVIPEVFDFGKLKRFGIQIGGLGSHLFSHSDHRLAIEDVDVRDPLPEWTKKLIVERPATILDDIENINNIMPDLSHAGFNKFEHIELKRCRNVSSLVDKADGEGNINEKFLGDVKHLELQSLERLEALWNCSDQYISLSNLVTLYINGCDKLERLFSVSVAQGLGNLQNLSIVNCENLVEVIWDGLIQAEIVFPSLTKITLRSLNKLERFSEDSSIKYPSLVDVSIMYCPSMKTWGLPPGRHEAPKLKFVGKMPLVGTDATINDIVARINAAAH